MRCAISFFPKVYFWSPAIRCPIVTRAVQFPIVAVNLLPLDRQQCTPLGRQRCATLVSRWCASSRSPAVRISMVASGTHSYGRQRCTFLVCQWCASSWPPAVRIPMVASSGAPPLVVRGLLPLGCLQFAFLWVASGSHSYGRQRRVSLFS